MDWNQRPAPFSGFGLAPNTSVKFMVMQPGGRRAARMTDWESRPNLVTLEIAGSNRVITQRLGRAPWTIELRLFLENRQALAALDAWVGQRATLWYEWGITTEAGGTFERLGDQGEYLRLDGTLLERITDVRHYREGLVECTATFSRAYGGS